MNKDVNDFENKNGEVDLPKENKAVSKEEMAKMIARNLSANQEDISNSDLREDKAAVEFSVRNNSSDFYSDRSSVQVAEKPSTKKNTEKKASADKPKTKKKSSSGKYVAIICTTALVAVIVAAAALYLTGMKMYKGVFLDNTYINDINVSGKTEEEACRLIEEKSLIPDNITIDKIDGTSVNIPVKDIGYINDTKSRVAQYFSQQNHYAWFLSKFDETKFDFTSDFKYDKDKLEKALKAKLIAKDGGKKPTDAYLAEDEDGNGYVVVNEKAGTKIDSSKKDILYKYIEEKLDDDNFTIDISDVDCYLKPKVTAEQLQPACDKLNSLADMEITFDFIYTTETLSGDKIMEWIDLDEDSEGYTVDKDKAMKYVEELAEKYDTFGKTRKFKTTKRGTITIPEGEGCYGWWIDQEKTRDLIVKLINKGKSTKTNPIYYVNPDSQYSYTCKEEWRTADSDYSNTYVEVDLTAQHLWYYEKGKLKMETDIVSGYPSESRNTPAGVYKLWYKEKGKTLRGSSDGVSYASYVDYWNYISTIGIGLHDASWQNGVFGGTKYKSITWGSHGCINMPFDKAKYVYENIDLDTPVFMYW